MRLWHKSLRYFVPLIIFLILALFFLLGLKQDPNAVPSVLIGKALPAFSEPSLLNPQQQITNQTLKGQVSLINVWASWCYSCRAEHWVLQAIKQTQGIKIFGINYKDERTDAEKMLAKMGNPYDRVIFDPKGKLAMNLGVYGTPETFIIDQYGIIRYRHVGPISPRVWQHELLPRIHRLQGARHETS